MKIQMVLLGAAVCVLMVAGPAGAQGFPKPAASYSADQVMETEQMSIQGRVYESGQKSRMEMSVSGSSQISIMRRDKQVTWMLIPDQRMYMEHAFGTAESSPDGMDDYQVEWTDAGEETIDGIPTKKSKVVMTHRKDGTKMGGFMWMTKKEGILLKIDAIAVDKDKKHRFRRELKNLKVGPQPDSLFEIPPGYQKMPSFPGMTGGQPGARPPAKPAEGGADPAQKRGGREKRMPPESPYSQPPASGQMPPGFENLPPEMQEMIRKQMEQAGQ